MKKQQKQNLKSLLKLPTLMKEKGSDFDMHQFFYLKCKPKGYINKKAVGESDYDCKTSACLAGYLPLTTKIPKKDGEEWQEYIFRVVGLDCESDEWDFLFSPCWDSDLLCAMDRVADFIKDGYKVPAYEGYHGEYND